MASAGAEVTLAVRGSDAKAAVAAATMIMESPENKQIFVAPLDLADPASVIGFVEASSGPLDILVNNAGIMAVPEQYTPQGWELHFATNHLGHSALATGLHGALAAADGARVVVVTSAPHLASPIVFDDIHFRFRPYFPYVAYAQSKTANALFAVEASRRWAADGVTANAAMPGYILTNLQQNDSAEALAGMTRIRVPEPKTIEQGAATSVLLATSPLLDGTGGRYFEDGNEAEVVHDSSGWIEGVAPWALDPGNAERLWDVSEKMSGRYNGPSVARTTQRHGASYLRQRASNPKCP